MKKLLLLLGIIGVCSPAITSAQIKGITLDDWKNNTNEYWFEQQCDEVREVEIYQGHYGIYLDNFVNPSTNPWPLYLWYNKVITRGKHLLYNPSLHAKGNGMLIFNRDLLAPKGWKINAGEKVRHLTTAEEVSEATFKYDWKLTNPYTAFDGKQFTKPNYRSDGTHPEKPTHFPSWDAEFRAITFYDSDNNLNTTKNNRAIVECQRNVVRWCGDGILDAKYNEQCDPNDPNKTGWGNGGCDTSCKPINNPEPVCSSTYHNTTTYNTNFPTPRMQQTAPLCTQGKVGEFVFDATTGKYTWKCNGEAWTTPVQCQAQDLRCGDGTKNGSEQCDPKDLNKSGWGNGGCDTSCKPINNPEPACHSDYNGKTLENLTAGNHLCNPGTMTNFKLEGNTWTWKCNGEAGTTPADCSANKKEEAPIYDLALTKKLADKKSSYKPGDDIFIIFTIYNQGNREATNIQLTDYIPEGLEVTDSMWNDVGNTSIYFFTDTIAPGMSAEVYMKATIKPDFKGSKIVNKAEISKDNSGDYNTTDKDSTPNSNPSDDCYSGDDKHIITGNGKTATAGNCTDTTDEDDHDGVSIPIDQPTPPVDPVNYDLALTKTIANKKASYKAGDELEFIFTIYNQGNKEAKNIEVTDYFPSDLELLDTTWTLLGDKASKTLTETIAPGANKTLMMKVRIKPDFKGTKIVNKAEISKDNSGDYNTVDKDSTPNSNPSDDCYSGDDKHIITGNGKTATAGNCTDATDEDDHDGVSITIDARPEIKKNLTGDPKHHYKIGELVGFKMPFKNTTANTLLKVSIKDFLPLNLEYVSSEIHGVSPVLSGLSLRQGVTVLEYSGFNLSPNQEGYLLFTGRVKADHLTERINTVGIYVNDLLVESDTETYKVIHPNLMIEKLVDKKVVNSGDVATFTLNIRALSGVFDELKVIDTLPKGLVYVENTQKLTNSTTNTTITDFSTGKNTNNLDTLNWKLAFADKIKAGQSFQLQFQARLVEASNGKYTNTACVEDPKTSHDPICDTEDVTPRDPKGDLSIKKYVNKVSADAGREDILMEGFTKWQTAFFTLEVRDAKQAITGFVVEDVVEGNLEYLDSSDLLNNAFTGLYLRAGANTDPYSYQATLKTEKIAGNKTRLQWKVEMTQGNFLPGDVYKIQFKAKVNGDQKNIGTVEYSTPNTPNGKSEDDASVKTNEVWLTIKKYVSDRIDGNWQDDSLQLSNGTTAYFKLVIWGATNSLTGFKITDKVENNLKYLDSTDLANNAFTGVITFGVNNPGKPAYTITPKATGTHPTDLEWQIDMGGAFFMPGDELVIIFKAQKNGDQTNIAHVYYPKRDGTTGHAQDPARVTTPSSGGGWGWWWGWGWWGWSGGWYSPSCGNGRKDGNEICDLGSTQTVGSDWKLFTSTDEYNKAYAGYTCTNTCRLKKDGSIIAPQCFNLQNGSISIMKGEMLPFYRNMEAQAGKATQAEKTAWLRNNFVFACGDTNDLGKISLRSMQCSFKVYGPGKQNSNEIYSFTAPCALSLNAWLDANNNLYPALKSYIAQNKKGWFGGSELNEEGLVKNVFDSLDNREYPTLLPLSSKLLITNFGTPSAVLHKSSSTLTRHSSDITTFGEYKVALEKVDYQICNGKDEKGKQIAPKDSSTDERICEVDFAVTDPYLIQKSPYGIGNKATTDLRKYQLKNGTSFMDEYFKTEIKDPKDYQAPENMQKLFTTFKNKYQRIAKPLGNGLSKVPGKSIYFYSGDKDITSVLGQDVIKKPFTLIAASKNQKVTIKGSLFTNAMIMTAGEIHIDASASCNGNKTKYGRAGQVLQGIFYAGEGFKSIGHENLKNTEANLHKGERCNYGNLHIKGVAIGDLSEVVNHRRSELYEWFSADASKGSEKKKEIVVNGASVLVDYNPSLRGQLPPGAEEFNKALEVYRK